MRLWKYLLDLWQRAFRRPTVVDRLAAGQPVESKADLAELVLWSLRHQPHRWHANTKLGQECMLHESGMVRLYPGGGPDGTACWNTADGEVDATVVHRLMEVYNRHPAICGLTDKMTEIRRVAEAIGKPSCDVGSRS